MATKTPFPTDIAKFPDDDRIYFSKEDNVHLLTDEDGKDWEFNERAGKWTEYIDAAQFKQMQSAFDVADTTEDAEANGEVLAGNSQKRKGSPNEDVADGKKPKKAKAGKGKNGNDAQHKVAENRAVFVSELPTDTTIEELDERFSRYGGAIDTGLDGNKRIKMYKDDQGNFNGQALIVFARKESVVSAVDWLNEYPLRPEQPKSIMKVAEADPSYRKTKDVKFNRKDKAKNAIRQAKKKQALDEWSDDEPSEIPTEVNRYANIVILKNCFTLKELDDDPEAILDIKAEVREKAEEFGEVTNVVMYDREPKGILSVRFRKPQDALKFQEEQNGVYFGPTPVEASIATERPRFKKSGRGTVSDDEEEAERLDNFGKAKPAGKSTPEAT